MFIVLRFLLRVIGSFLLAAALVAMISDGSRTIGQSELVLLSSFDFWMSLSADSLAEIRAGLETSGAPFLWDPVLETFLSWPVWVGCSILGVICLWIGRTRSRDTTAIAF
ncbi:MAG: hypothetical protein ABJP02_06230 [Parasphingorhabdus sp.]|uniref:hypothetical protein n=1 Tax=Alphaproteobacteria TaxID=28211 RepID=UPI003267201C